MPGVGAGVITRVVSEAVVRTVVDTVAGVATVATVT